MQVEKISFTSSILEDMTAKAATFQVNKQQAQPTPAKVQQPQIVSQTEKQKPQDVVAAPIDTTSDKSKNKTKRNTIVGIGVLAVLVGLGIAGRKGKLGPKIQKFLGGAERAAGKGGDEIADIGSIRHEIKLEDNLVQETVPPLSDIKTVRLEPADARVALARLDKNTKEEIEKINGLIDRNIPLIDDNLKTISAPTKKECVKIIEEDIDINTIKRSDCLITDDGTIFYDLYKDGYKVSVEFNPDKSFKSFTKFNTKDDYKTVTHINFGEGKAYSYEDGIANISVTCDKDGNLVWLQRKISPNITLRYDDNGQIKDIINRMPTDITRKVNHTVYENGKISWVFYYNPKAETNTRIKMEHLDDTGKIIRERYVVNDKDIVIDL